MPDDQPTPPEVVIAAYSWAPGRCFRCRADDVPTASVGSLPQARRWVDVRACEPCVLVMEQDRERAAWRYGWPYDPGTPPPP